jgi:hypothetical protein
MQLNWILSCGRSRQAESKKYVPWSRQKCRNVEKHADGYKYSQADVTGRRQACIKLVKKERSGLNIQYII